MDGDDDEESEKAPVLTLDEVKKWSKALLEVRPFAFCYLFVCGEVNVAKLLFSTDRYEL